ncbi:sensor domain-containing diguanylate cyclase [Acetobacterium wieringae]|uniref:Response regulator PleD n=1 Tax=Acetobacterium wieringae TaxID=52694 RepID=A0A1F2PFS1_9FIRM|nr:GGDEF domain-containing protein [Acetobacterium wieringae]OFV69546.1 response regulator PleD [Acetobacterium wieringae]URN82737.1 diguanylate cyclase [Acetobacterium wieringae]
MSKNMSVVNIETINEDNRKKLEEQSFEEAVLALTEKLELANSLLKTMLETTHEFLVFGLDRDYRYLSFNNRHKEMAKDQWGADIAIGTRILDIINSNEERDNLRGFFDRVLAGEQFSSLEEYEGDSGNVIVGKNHWAPIKNSNGEIIGILCFMQDVTEHRSFIKEMLKEKNSLDQNMESLSFYDQLTGVYNRKFYEKELQRMDEEQYYPLSIIFMNINGMSKINSEYGHAVGDILMRKAVQVLKYGVRGDDVVARYEGDEFVVLMPRTEGAKVERALERFKKSLDEVKVQSIKLSVSFGFYTKYDESDNTESVIKAAQRQLERQKELDYI